MSIKYKKGNAVSAVLNGEADILLHVANCQGVMGSGIALEVKNRIPSSFTNYIKSGYKLGDISISNDFKVCNLHAQEFYGREKKRYISYKALVECLLYFNDYCEFESEKSRLKIAIPYKMGSDRAGGDWETVLEIVDGFLHHHEIIVYEL